MKIMDKYTLFSNRDKLLNLLSSYNHNYTKNNKYKEISTDENKFYEENKLRNFFISILNEFDLQKYLSLGNNYLEKKIEDWNNTNLEEKITIHELEKKLCIIRTNYKFVINPFIGSYYNKNSVEVQKNKYLRFIFSISLKEYEYFYLFFDNDFLKNFINKYNQNNKTNITFEFILSNKKNLYESLFHNFHEIFHDSLKMYITSIEYSDWELNIEKYFFMLFELYSNRLFYESIENVLSSNKKMKLECFCINFIKNDLELLKYEDINFLNKLPYFFEKINLKYEMKNNPMIEKNKYFEMVTTFSLAPYSKIEIDNKNLFEKVSTFNRRYNSPESHVVLSLYENIIYFSIVNNLIKPNDWSLIFKSKDYNFYKNLISQRLFTDFNDTKNFYFIEISNFIIKELIHFEYKDNFKDLKILNIEKLLCDLLQNYLEIIDDASKDFLSLIINLYIYLSNSSKISNLIIDLKTYLSNYTKSVIKLDKNNLELVFSLFKKLDIVDFKAFDLLLDIGTTYKHLEKEISEIILNYYISFIEKDYISLHFYEIESFSVLIFMFEKLDIEKIKNELIKDNNFIDIYNSNDSNKYKKDQKIRFHLGVVSKVLDFLTDPIKKELLLDYTLEIFRNLKKLEYSPFSLRYMMPNTPEKLIVDSKDIITYYISKNLNSRDYEFIEKYINDIYDFFSITELIIIKNELKESSFINGAYIDKKYQVNKTDGYDIVKKEAFFLIRNGFPKYGLKYLNYIESLDQERRDYFVDDTFLSLKYESFLMLKELDMAQELLIHFKDKRKITLYEGLILYFKEQFNEAEEKFRDFFLNNEPELTDIINYSAILIQLGKNNEAIDLIEGFISKYSGEDHLLYLNLGLAYYQVNNIKSLYFISKSENYIESKDIRKISFITSNILKTLKDLLPEFVDRINKSDIKTIETEVINGLVSSSQNAIRKLSKFNIEKQEKLIIGEIYNAVQRINSDPKQIEGFSEDRLSNYIKDIIYRVLLISDICVERERRGGFSQKNQGEIDLYFYINSTSFLISVGENKEWNGEKKFKKQLEQLLGYMTHSTPFCFTITYVKSDVKLDEIKEKKKKVLEKFNIENEFFNVNKILDAENLFEEKFFLKDVLVSIHKNPEMEDSYVRIYHFTIDSSCLYRKEVAKKAREKRKINNGKK